MNLRFDGTFFDSTEKTNHVDESTVFAVRENNLNSQQIFVH